MFNIGSKEILIIALIILFLFGSKKLTEWAKGLGDAGRELKKAKKEFSDAMDETDKDIKKTLDMNEGKKENKQSLPSGEGEEKKISEGKKDKENKAQVNEDV